MSTKYSLIGGHMEFQDLINKYETYDKKDKKKDLRITDDEKRKFDELKAQGYDIGQILRMTIHYIYDEVNDNE